MPPPIEYQSADVTVHGVTIKDLPVGAMARLNSKNMTGGRKPTHDPPGFVRGDCQHHHQRGHLIGNTLGGPGTNPNLVTLTEGTNHPFMYEFENLVKHHVGTHPGRDFLYIVAADYEESDYFGSDPLRVGVGGNPYCVFPAPSRLRLCLLDDHHVPQLTQKIPDENKVGNFAIILNGIYKFHSGSVNHVAKGCWASTDNTPSVKCYSCRAERQHSSAWYTRWHVCPQCYLQCCDDCGKRLRPTSLFSLRRVRDCPTCGRTMMLW